MLRIRLVKWVIFMAVRKKAKTSRKKGKVSVKKAEETVPEKKAEEKSLGNKIGKVEHYYTNIGVGVIKLSGTLKVGDKIRIKGATTDFEQKVDSMQIEKDKIQEAKKGKSIGLKVKDHVRQNDVVYKV